MLSAVSVAPMMGYTHRHFRYLLRLMSRRVCLYTEMIPAQAILHGNPELLLAFDHCEKPVVLQLGGHEPHLLAAAARCAQTFGYDAINLNVGCPSASVSAGHFGAVLLKQPERVAECIAAMCSAVTIPVTVKTRIGVDRWDRYADLARFVRIVAQQGCRSFIIHARKAWLKGLNPRKNRSVPPLNYARVYRLKQDFQELTFIVNGGIKTIADIKVHQQQIDGVMIGRAVCHNPYLLARFDQELFGDQQAVVSRRTVALAYTDYMHQHRPGSHSLISPLISLYHGVPHVAKKWRHYWAQYKRAPDSSPRLSREIQALLQYAESVAAQPVLHEEQMISSASH